MSQLSGNKGEWSELYVFLKLLAEGRLYSADSDVNVLEEIYYDVLSIYRLEEEGRRTYSIDKLAQKINISKVGEQTVEKEFDVSLFLSHAEKILTEIKGHKTGGIQIPEVDIFAKNIMLQGLCASAREKADIHMKTYDYKTGTQPDLSFSIKSQLGSPATLLNASRTTNFKYRVEHNMNDQIMVQFNTIKNFKEKFNLLERYGVNVIFEDVINRNFLSNLLLMDGYLPQIIAEYLKESFLSNEKKLDVLTPIVAANNNLEIEHENLILFYSYKWKEFLTNVALGVLPGSIWDGEYEATGGYIIVKEDGDIVCYHIYNRNEFRSYLYKNIKFENGSTSRNNFGNIYKEGSDYYLNLNLQLRFLK